MGNPIKCQCPSSARSTPPKPKVLFFFLSLPFPFVPSLPRTGPSPGPSLCSPKCPCLTLFASSSVSFCLRGLQLFLSCVPRLTALSHLPLFFQGPPHSPSSPLPGSATFACAFISNHSDFHCVTAAQLSQTQSSPPSFHTQSMCLLEVAME